MFDSVFGRSFNSGKCKTLLRLAISRIKLLRNKRDMQLKQMKKELVQLLQTNQEPSARIRVEHIYREQNIMAAYELLELFCELIVVRLPIMESQRQCPIDLREAVASLIFAAPRCSDVPELLQVRNLLSAKYGKEFVIAAAELRPDCGVNRVVIEKLSVRAPSGEVKLKLMKDIAAEHNLDWDPSATESELLKAPEDLLEGPTRFLGASQMALETPIEEPRVAEPGIQQSQKSGFGESKGTAFESTDVSAEKQFIPFVLPTVSNSDSIPQTIKLEVQKDTNSEYSPPTSLNKDTSLGSDHYEDTAQSSSITAERYKDVVAAARAAAESAERAAAAARAAALLASEKFGSVTPESSSDSGDDDDDGNLRSDMDTRFPEKHQFNSFNNGSTGGKPLFDEPEVAEEFRSFSTQGTTRREVLDENPWIAGESVWPSSSRIGNFDEQDGSTGVSFSSSNLNGRGTHRSSSFESAGASPQFDSDSTEERDSKRGDVTAKFKGEKERSTERMYSNASHVHPKLPDFDDLTARFEALRSKR